MKDKKNKSEQLSIFNNSNLKIHKCLNEQNDHLKESIEIKDVYKNHEAKIISFDNYVSPKREEIYHKLLSLSDHLD